MSAGAADSVRRVDCLRAGDSGPRGLHPVQSDDARSTFTFVWGGAQEPQSGFLGRELRREAAVGGRPCDHAARVPAVRVVREPGGASDPAHRRSGGHSSCFAETGTHNADLQTLQVQFLEVVDMLVGVQRQVLGELRVQSTVEVPQLQYFDKVVDVPVRQGPHRPC